MSVRPRRILVYRHSVLTRITHWINVLCILVLVMSGLQIFNAHPALYFGQKSDFDKPALAMRAVNGPDGAPIGVTTIGGATFTTTGVLGLSAGSDGELRQRGFPSWITLPSYQDLSTGRRWHFFFAWLFVINGAVYLIASFLNGHVWRDLLPTGRQLREIGKSIGEHLRLRFGHGDEARNYNVLQKLAYIGVIFVVLPLLILAGLAMSPGVDAAVPWLTTVFGGRQTARTIHFICASLIVLFVLVHVIMVLISGVWNNIRSMITGRYAIVTTAGETGDKP
ncbi:MAG: cytochrome b/b6 domain-containing protein [Bauldia sp.]